MKISLFRHYIKEITIVISVVFILLVFVPSIGFLTAQQITEYDLIYNSENNWSNLNYFENVFIHTSGIEEGSLTIAENRSGPNKNTELMLTFDYDNQNNWTDLNTVKYYKILNYEFLVSYENKKHGSSAGRFYGLKDGVSLMPLVDTIFQAEESAGSFTIDFWIYFNNTYNNQIIFEKKGQVISPNDEPITAGITSRLYDNHIEVNFKNIFYYLSSFVTGKPYSEDEIKLVSRDIIVPEKWYHVAITFDEKTGLLSLFTNGTIQQNIWCTDDKSSNGEIHIPKFLREENSPLLIATGLNGMLDDFHIQRKAINHFELSKYIIGEGIIKSNIIDLKYNGSTIDDVWINSINKSNSTEIFEFRLSSDYFLPETDPEKLRWINVNIKSEIPEEFLRGKYLQWRLRLLAGDMYEYSPFVKSININVDYNLPPRKILNIEGESRNGLLILSWDGSIEKDIKAYKIYYSTESGNYLSEGSIITVSKSQLLNTLKPSYIIRGLEKDVVYYISVTAIDNYDIESDFSKEISVRIKY